MGDDSENRSVRGRAVALICACAGASLALLVGACSSNTSDAGAPSGTEPRAQSDVTLPTEGTPSQGGTLRYALASETDGFDPTVNRWVGDSTEVALTMFDPLAAYAADGSAAPYLAASFDPDETFTTWAITVRPDIVFHDGTPLDAGVVKRNLDLMRASLLTGAALAPVNAVEVTGPLTLDVSMSQPWASFPVALTGQAGAVAAPSQLDDPDGTRKPVGTGPFELVNWVPDKELIVTRNERYWRTDESGASLPYLDGIEFRPIPDDAQRVNSMETGEVDMMWTATAGAVIRLRELAAAGQVQTVEQPGQTEVGYVLLNLGAPPFDDPTARLAIAHATDNQAWVDVIQQGVFQPADTLFRPGTNWYADIPIPGYDLAAAQQEVTAYEAEHGPLSIRLSVLSTSTSRQQGEFLQQMWQAAGIDVEVLDSEATAFLAAVVGGDYSAALFAQFGSPDPDYEQVWWRSSSSRPVGELSLNFARHTSAETDAALDAARESDDPSVRKAAYDDVQRTFAEDLPYIYLDYWTPVVAANNRVRGITNGPLPDGQAAVPMGGPGSFSYVTRLVQTWVVPD